MIHEELVQTMKWKQTRGKYYPQLSYLVKVNTPRAVMAETKKAFRKLPNLEQAITALSNLKGVGTTMASGMFALEKRQPSPTKRRFCSTPGSSVSRERPLHGRRVSAGDSRHRRHRLHHEGVPEVRQSHPGRGREVEQSGERK